MQKTPAICPIFQSIDLRHAPPQVKRQFLSCLWVNDGWSEEKGGVGMGIRMRLVMGKVAMTA